MFSLEMWLNMLNFQAAALEGQETNVVTDYIIKVAKQIQQIFMILR